MVDNRPERSYSAGMRNTLEKVFAVLEVVASGEKPVTLKEIARRTGHHPSTVSRILADLAEIGYVRKESYREFSLDLGLVPLGQMALTHFPLARLAIPLVAGSAARLGCHGALVGLHRDRLVYLYRSTLQQGSGTLPEDFRYPLHRANSSMALLSARPDEEARRLLAESLKAETGRAPAAKVAALMKRLAAARRDGYATVREGRDWNVAFPLAHGGRTFAVSLHGTDAGAGGLDKRVLECSLLVRRIEAAAGAAVPAEGS
jgi:IclR family pca regulon transcriptional regulator